MTNQIMNDAKGGFAEMGRDDPSLWGVLLLEAAEADDALVDHANLDALLLAAGNTEATFINYVRDTGLTAVVTVNNTTNEVDLDLPDSSWPSAGPGNAVVKLLTFLDEGGTELTRRPTSHHDFAVSPDGSDLVAQWAATGAMRAQQG